MKKCIAWANKKVKKMDVWDVKMIKASVFFFALWLAFVYTPLTEWFKVINPWIWFVLFVMMIIRPFYHIWIKK